MSKNDVICEKCCKIGVKEAVAPVRATSICETEQKSTMEYEFYKYRKFVDI